MKVLIVGGGGREHALAWKAGQSPLLTKLYTAPGNPGTAQLGENLPISKAAEIVAWLGTHPVDLVIIGPDNYLADGLADEIAALRIPVFGPSRAAAEIEWSKRYAKTLMQEAGIPTARFRSFTDFDEARRYVAAQKPPIVVKASGLALGKGVVIASSVEEAQEALSGLMEKRLFGAAGAEVVIEEYLEGREISVHALCDGERAALFPPAQDHKRIGEGDTGPNTGGMGTIAPVPWVTEGHMTAIRDRVILPLLAALSERGRPFRGLLFPGIMITAEGPKVIEVNARFGDPETQSYMRLLDSDLVGLALACARGSLAGADMRWKSGAACCVVAASGGYPGEYAKGREIKGLSAISDPDVAIFHAGVALEVGRLVTSGGRVLGVTATGVDLRAALDKAYAALKTISFSGMQYRKDIGQKSLP